MSKPKHCILSLLACLFAWSANAYEISCERYSNEWSGFESKEAMESVYPKTVQFNATEFSTKYGSTSVFYSETLGGTKVNATLLKSGKLVVTYPEYASYVTNGRYDCDADATEVAAFIQSEKKPNVQPNSTTEYQAAWSCGKTLDDVFLSLDKNGTLTKDEDNDDVEVYGLLGDDRLTLIRMTGEDASQENFELMSSIIDNMEWTKRGDTYIGNGVLTLAEFIFGVTFMLNDEQSVGSMVMLGNPDVVSSMGIHKCQRLY